MGNATDNIDLATETIDGLYKLMNLFDLTNIQRREFNNVINTIENLKNEVVEVRNEAWGE